MPTEKVSSEIINAHVRAMLNDVHPSWRKIILHPKIKQYFVDCLDSLYEDLKSKGVPANKMHEINMYIRPRIENVFECFKYFDVNNLKAIFIGQDPYPKPDEAHGLCFSVPHGVKIPSSLYNVYNCLNANKLIPEIPNHGNLVAWANQGILMMNMYLTRSVNIVKGVNGVRVDGNGDSKDIYLHKFWGNFTTAIVNFIINDFFVKYSNHDGHHLFVVQWGRVARSMPIDIQKSNKRTVEILQWSHPSPLNQANCSESEKFVNCDHFTKINNYYSIDWNPNVITNPQHDQFLILRQLGKVDDFISELNTTTRWFYNDTTSTDENNRVCEFIKNKKLQEEREIVKVGTIPIFLSNDIQDDKFMYYVEIPVVHNTIPSGISTLMNIKESVKIYGLVPSYKYGGKAEVKPTNNRSKLLGLIHAFNLLDAHIKENSVLDFIIYCDDIDYLKVTLDKMWSSQLDANDDLCSELKLRFSNIIEKIKFKKQVSMKDKFNTVVKLENYPCVKIPTLEMSDKVKIIVA
jgi:uracil-DNA glycosylase